MAEFGPKCRHCKDPLYSHMEAATRVCDRCADEFADKVYHARVDYERARVTTETEG